MSFGAGPLGDFNCTPSTEGSLWYKTDSLSSPLAITLSSVKNETALLSSNLISGNCE